MSRGYSQNIWQDLRNSSTAQTRVTEICAGTSHRPDRDRRSNSTLLKQSVFR